MENRTFFVYVDRKPDGTPFYVGKGTAKRLRWKERNEWWSRTTKKYPDWKRETVFSGSEDECFAEEKRLIALYGRRNLFSGTLVNLTDGGDGVSGWIATPEWKEANSVRQKGRKHSAKSREKIKIAAINMSPESRQKIADSNRGQKRNSEQRARMSVAHKGKKLSEKHRINVALARVGMTVSDETRKKISESLKGKTHSEERKQRIRDGISKMSPEKKAELLASRKSITLSAEHRAKISESNRKRVRSEESRRKQAESMRATLAKKRALQIGLEASI